MFSRYYNEEISLILDFENQIYSSNMERFNLLDQVSFTRATTATYFDSNGVMQTAGVNEPRINYDPVTGECLGLLIEEARTNLLTYSEQFDNAAWDTQLAVVSVNQVIAPDSELSADKLVTDAGVAGRVCCAVGVASSSSGHTLSVYAKAGELSNLFIFFEINSNFVPGVSFNLSSGTVGTVLASGGFNVVTPKIESVGNGWYRCSAVFNTAGGTITRVGLVQGSSYSGAGDGTSGIYIWGAQIEAGSFPTSYIPTEASAVTRAADVIEITDTSWLGATESTAIRKWLNGTNEFEEVVTYRDIDEWVPAHDNMQMLSEVVYPTALTSAQKAALAPNAPWMSAVIYDTSLDNMRFYTGGATSNIYVTGSDGTQQTIALSADADSNHTITVPLPARIEWPLDTALQQFFCNSNQLTGSIPDLSSNTALQYFYCNSNQLTGSIPDLSSNTALQNFYCYSNQLTGSIPDLSSNTALQYFYCYSNQLTGSIPDLSSNTALQYFYCYSNQLTGSIPDLSSNTALLRFYCYSNQLTGSIPDLSSNTALAYFLCNINQLTGSIPDLSSNTALQYFNCYSNQLTGSIPDLSSNTALQYFYCHINQLTGSIPDLSSNTALQYFYCYSNQLTGWTGGTVSATLGDFQAYNNLLPQSVVDAILAAFVAAGRTSASGTCILNIGGTGNAAPSATGITDKNTLISRGWTVTTN
jgi:Leucine-rich repeat (LRR) protein